MALTIFTKETGKPRKELMKKRIAALAFITLLAACADTPAPPPKREYVLPPKINLDVQSLSLTDRSGMQSANSPYNSNDFQPTIAQAVRQWAKDRLQAVGAEGQAMVIIKDASLVQQAIPYEHDIFTRQQASKYVAHVSIDVEAKGREGYAVASAEASRFVTLPENPTVAERQKAYFDVLNGLMRDVGTKLEGSIQDHMHDFVITVPMFDGSAPGSVPPVSVSVPVSGTVPLSGPNSMSGPSPMLMDTTGAYAASELLSCPIDHHSKGRF